MKLMKPKCSFLGAPIFLTLSVIMGLPGITHADAIFDAVAVVVDLSITGFNNSGIPLPTKPTDLIIAGNALVIDEDAETLGDSFADRVAGADVNAANANNLEFIGEGLSQQAITTGNTSFGAAASFAFTEGTLLIDNLSSIDTYSIDFDTDFLYFVEASVDNPNLEFAQAAIEISLESQSLGFVLDITEGSDSDLGGGLFIDEGIEPFSLSVAPGQTELLTLTVNALGAAISDAPRVVPIPEPSTLTLFGVGLLGAALIRSRHRTIARER